MPNHPILEDEERRLIFNSRDVSAIFYSLNTSHTLSYIGVRARLKDLGDVMGFDDPGFKPYNGLEGVIEND